MGRTTTTLLKSTAARIVPKQKTALLPAPFWVHLRVEPAHFDWRWLERPALALLAWPAAITHRERSAGPQNYQWPPTSQRIPKKTEITTSAVTPHANATRSAICARPKSLRSSLIFLCCYHHSVFGCTSRSFLGASARSIARSASATASDLMAVLPPTETPVSSETDHFHTCRPMP